VLRAHRVHKVLLVLKVLKVLRGILVQALLVHKVLKAKETLH
jgi:hypothetical protein